MQLRLGTRFTEEDDCDLKVREHYIQTLIIKSMKLLVSFKVGIFGSQTEALLRGLLKGFIHLLDVTLQ